MVHDTALPLLRQRQSLSARAAVTPPGAGASPETSLGNRPPSEPRSLYIHVPFCFHKCHYCDFYSIVDTQDRQREFTARLVRELTALTPLAHGKPLETIFVGGGTPSLLRVDLWEILLACLNSAFDLSRIRAGLGEFTVECNPETVSPELMAVLRGGGVDRVSVGAQSFNPAHLKTLERWHDPANVVKALELARAAGIPRQSIDLIYGIPGQTMAEWEADLQAALALKTTHLSCYSLTYEPNTAMTARLKRGDFTPIDEDLDADMHLFTLEALRRGGLERYEVSNFAKPGHESKHNLAYWRQEAWLAAGPSASGHLHGNRWKNVPRLDDYLTFDDHGYSAIVDLETFEPVRALTERIMTGVRILEGVDWTRVLDDAERLRPGARSRLVQTRAKLEGRGMAISDADDNPGSRLVLTDGGFMIADAIALELIVALEGRGG
jgi:oxygen-independent coproporphyrinogen III oxidase